MFFATRAADLHGLPAFHWTPPEPFVKIAGLSFSAQMALVAFSFFPI